MAVPFTQFLLPDGRRRQDSIELSPAAEAKAARIMAAGLRFEMELLRDYQTVSLTIADPRRGEDLAIKLCRNGPGMRDVIERLIAEFDPQTALRLPDPSRSGVLPCP